MLATAPEKLAADETLMCSSVGPYKNKETLNKLLYELGSDLKQTDIRTDTEVKTRYLVLSEVFSSAKKAKDSMKKMQASGIKDIAKITLSGKHRISFGYYRWQSIAKNRVIEVKNKGFEAELKPRKKKIKKYWADVTYLPQAAELLNIIIPEKSRVACDESIKLSMLNNDRKM